MRMDNRYYRTPWPVAYPWEPHVPVPGWGFTPNLAGPAMLASGGEHPYAVVPPPVNGLGMDFNVHMPIIGDQRISLPVEDVVNKAVNTAWPNVQAKIQAEYEALIKQGIATMDKEVPVLINKNTAKLADQVWAQMQPKVEAELDKTVNETKKMLAIGVAAIALIVGASILIK